MTTLLLIVEDKFFVSDRFILVLGIHGASVDHSVGTLALLVRPNGSALRTTVQNVEYTLILGLDRDKNRSLGHARIDKKGATPMTGRTDFITEALY